MRMLLEAFSLDPIVVAGGEAVQSSVVVRVDPTFANHLISFSASTPSSRASLFCHYSVVVVVAHNAVDRVLCFPVSNGVTPLVQCAGHIVEEEMSTY